MTPSTTVRGLAVRGRRVSAAHGLFAVGLVAFGTVAARESTAAPASPIAVKVAVLEPTSGEFTQQTRLMANGLEIGARQPGQGVRISLTRKRFAPTAKPATLIQSLAGSGVTAVVLPCHPDQQAALGAEAGRRGLLVLAPCDFNARTAGSIPRYWSVGMNGNAETAQLVNFAALQNATNALILKAPRSSYSATAAAYFREAIKRRGLTVTGEVEVQQSGSNLDAVAKEIQRTRPRAVVTGLPAPQAVRIIVGLRSRGVLTPIYLTSGMDIPLDLNRFGESMKDVTFATYGFARPTTSRPFSDGYRKRFRRVAYGGFPGIGYETARVLRAAATKAKSADAAKLDRALATGLKVVGVATADNVYQSGAGRHPIADVALARLIRGEYIQVVSSVPPANTIPPA